MKGMKKGILGALLTGMLVFLLAACGGNDESKSKDAENANNRDGDTKPESNESSDDALQEVTSLTIIRDDANEVGGGEVDVRNSQRRLTRLHDYEPQRERSKHASDAGAVYA